MSSWSVSDWVWRIALLGLYLGKAWQYFFYSMPLEIGLPGIDAFAALFLVGCGISLCRPSPPNWMLIGSSVLFFVNTLAAWQAHSWEWPYLIEQTLAWSSPLLFFYWQKQLPRHQTLIKVGAALTFAGHGLYALGWPYPTPPHFYYMVQEILGLTSSQSILFLQVAGILDLILMIGIFAPQSAAILLVYGSFWGFTTALARPMAYVQLAQLAEGLHRWLMEFLFRLPHSLLPWLLWWQVFQKQRHADSPSKKSPLKSHK